VVVAVDGGRGEAGGAKAAEEGGAAPAVGLAPLVPGHGGPGGVDGELEIAVAAPVDGDAAAVHGPVRVRGVLVAHEVVEAVGVELDLPPASGRDCRAAWIRASADLE
jgi:hypothetical protein